MNTTSPARINPANQLAETAPLVRVTAGVGSAGQKTWNLRRPVTLIGTRRPAHIILHDRDVSVAHCVIVNTGTEVLVKDLHTARGTTCNHSRIGLAVLGDGDVLTIGTTKIQVAIRMPENGKEDSSADLEYLEPTKFRKPVTITYENTDKQWTVEDAVVLIGRHRGAAVRLDSPDVSHRHAVLFRFNGNPAIFDLGSRTGVSINGHTCSMGPLVHEDRLGIGPLTLVICTNGENVIEGENGIGYSSDMTHAEASSNDLPSSLPEQKHASETTDRCLIEQHTDGPDLDRSSDAAETQRATGADEEPSVPTLGHIQSELNTLESNIAKSWGRLNDWENSLKEDDPYSNTTNSPLAIREAELNAKDAALRGHLHDLTCYHEQVAAREKELERQFATIQEERDYVLRATSALEEREQELATIQEVRDDVLRAKSALEEREQEVNRRLEELKRREHVVAHRWTRLHRASCPHCGKSVHVEKA